MLYRRIPVHLVVTFFFLRTYTFQICPPRNDWSNKIFTESFRKMQTGDNGLLFHNTFHSYSVPCSICSVFDHWGNFWECIYVRRIVCYFCMWQHPLACAGVVPGQRGEVEHIDIDDNDNAKKVTSSVIDMAWQVFFSVCIKY